MSSIVKRGISQTILYAHNPSPKTSEEALLKEAKLSLIRPARVDPFVFIWRYGGGLEQEVVRLSPGEFLPIREGEETQGFTRAFRDQGGVLVPDPKDRKDVVQRACEGLMRAIAFYNERGREKLIEYQRGHGLTNEQMSQRRNMLWAYYLNVAKQDACQHELDRLSAKE